MMAMTMNVRMLGGSKGKSVVGPASGTRYSQSSGAFVDAHESDVNALASAGFTKVAPSGPTSARPAAVPGAHFVETTLSKVLVADDAGVWRDPINGNAV
jgi:hypothetical protein